MKIAVVGTGYVGLVTGTCLSETGNTVICVDIDEAKIKKMKSGKIPIYEPHLEGLFQRNIQAGRLRFTTNLSEGVKGAEVIFLALPTPSDDDGSADLSYVLGVADELGAIISEGVVIVDKSTVPVGTTERVYEHIGRKAKVSFDVVSNPEFLREGFAVEDFMKPDRIVVGASSKHAMKIMDSLFAPFVRQGNPILFMDERSAEMTKYAANAFLATKISFMNEIANLCERVGADVDAVRNGIGSDDRIGKRFLLAGIGYGGSCFPKDVKALHHTALANNYEFKILEAVSYVNSRQKEILPNKVLNHYGEDVKGRTFALWGLSFKPDTDDIREAPSLEIIDNLISAGAKIVAYDPQATKNVKKIYHNNKQITFLNDQYAVLEDVDALLIATEWPVFRSPDFARMKDKMKEPRIFDGRNLYDLETMGNKGFKYISIGRSVVDNG